MLLGTLDNGLGFYRFAYHGSDKTYVGVMAQEVQQVMPSAVLRGGDGYLRVRYEKIGVKFQTYERVAGVGSTASGCGGRRRSKGGSVKKHASILFAACVVAALATFSDRCHAQQAFKSPEEAGDALIAALRSDDTKAVSRVLGRAGNEIVSSGDEVQDDNTRKLVLAAYDVKHSIVKDKDGRGVPGRRRARVSAAVADRREGRRLAFDTVAGREEILYRRIGRNELAAIQVCLAYVDAQNEYAEMARGRRPSASTRSGS